MKWSEGSWRETWPRGRAVGMCNRKGCMDGGGKQREGMSSTLLKVTAHMIYLGLK